jgi:hypothetical protein
VLNWAQGQLYLFRSYYSSGLGFVALEAGKMKGEQIRRAESRIINLQFKNMQCDKISRGCCKSAAQALCRSDFKCCVRNRETWQGVNGMHRLPTALTNRILLHQLRLVVVRVSVRVTRQEITTALWSKSFLLNEYILRWYFAVGCRQVMLHEASSSSFRAVFWPTLNPKTGMGGSSLMGSSCRGVAWGGGGEQSPRRSKTGVRINSLNKKKTFSALNKF